MKTGLPLLIAVLLICGAPQSARAIGFLPLAVYIDSGSEPLASYQLEIDVTGAEIVGVEGGEHPAFRRAPYYDPAALQGSKIKLAGLCTARDLPTGRTRVATLHLMLIGKDQPQPQMSLTQATNAEAQPIAIKVELIPQTNGGKE